VFARRPAPEAILGGDASRKRLSGDPGRSARKLGRVTCPGLVAAVGFMLVVPLAASAGLFALGDGFQGLFAGKILLAVLNTVVSLAIFTLLFSAIYKALPDTAIPWHDLVLGAFVTAVPSAIGKSFRVNRAGLTLCQPLPVYPDQRTSSDRSGWSGSCQNRTFGQQRF
jgi:hypothetical protein